MSRHYVLVTFRLLAIAATAAPFLLAAFPVFADSKAAREVKTILSKCQGPFKFQYPTPAQLRAVLAKHNSWFRFYQRKYPIPREDEKVLDAHNVWFENQKSLEVQADLRRANLCGAILAGRNLSKRDLREADLSGTNLTYADLSRADLREANLSGASSRGLNLSGADLQGAQLTDALLYATDLSSASLFQANLSRTHLIAVDLTDANLLNANLSAVIFEPRTLPSIGSIAWARNLSQMGFVTSPSALIKLRTAFKEGGYRDQEREITYAIKNSEGRFDVGVQGVSERLFKYVFFDLTTRWGMAPARALAILLFLIPFFAVPYMVALRWPSKNGIWRVWPDKRMRRDLGTTEPERLRGGWLTALTFGLYFSVLSAFHIGWREFNVGTWIQRLQPGEYTLQATGWVRTVSGVQSLISLYLLAIWALTYFGRPFE